MSPENSGIQCLWPGKDRWQSGNDLLETHDPNIKIGTILRSFSHSGAMCIGKFCANILILVKGITMLAGVPILFSANTALATSGSVQANYAVPQLSQTSVTVAYTAGQVAGDLVTIGWSNTTAQISSVTDSIGNMYYLAAGPALLSGLASQSIYYANNTSGAGANAVTAVTADF